MTVSVMQVGYNTVPSAAPYYMGTGGTYIPKFPAVIRQNGLGLDIVGGYSSVEWSWEFLTVSDYLWWNGIMLGQPSWRFDQALLYSYAGTLVLYSNCILHRPTFDKIVGDTLFNVKVILDQLI